MAWNRVANYFALVTAQSPGLAAGIVLHGRDSFAEIREDREIWQRLTGGSFSIVWGLDGRPVTRGEAALLLNEREGFRTVTRLELGPDGKREVPVEYQEPVTYPPLHPRQIRSEAVGAPKIGRRAYEPLPAEPGCNACAVRVRNLLVAEISPVCEGVQNAPKPTDQPRPPRVPAHTPPPGAPDPHRAASAAIHGRPGAVREAHVRALPDDPPPVPER